MHTNVAETMPIQSNYTVAKLTLGMLYFNSLPEALGSHGKLIQNSLITTLPRLRMAVHLGYLI